MRHVWITGAGRGIGAAVALAFARQGAALSLSGRNLDTLKAQKKVLEESCPGVKVHLSPMDLSDPQSVIDAHRSNQLAFGPVEVLINNAGQALSQPFAKTDLKLWQQMLSVNLTGTYLCIQSALPDLLLAGGQGKAARIVNIASTAGLKGYAYVSAYTAAKHGVIGLTRSLALELARKGVTVNAVCPGSTLTDFHVDRAKGAGKSIEQLRSERKDTSLIGRWADPEEIAWPIVWLSSNEASFITGTTLMVDGGLHIM